MLDYYDSLLVNYNPSLDGSTFKNEYLLHNSDFVYYAFTC